MIQRLNELFVWLWSSTDDSGCKHHLGRLDSCWPRSVDGVWKWHCSCFRLVRNSDDWPTAILCKPESFFFNHQSWTIKHQSAEISQTSMKLSKPPLVGISVQDFCGAFAALGLDNSWDWIGLVGSLRVGAVSRNKNHEHERFQMFL